MSARNGQPQMSPRLAMQLRLGLNGGCRCEPLQSLINSEASALGLTAGEIEASRQFRSFDVRDAAALELACALYGGASDVQERRATAECSGITANLAAAIEQFTLAFRRCSKCL